MSLTLILRARDGIVMAADSRVTEGYTLDGPKTRDDSVKFIQLDKNTAVMTHGLYDIGDRGIHTLKEHIGGSGEETFPYKKLVYEGKKVFTLINEEWENSNPVNPRRAKDVGFVIGGLDREDMEFRVYCLESPDFEPRIITGNLFLAGQWHIARFLLTKFELDGKPVKTLKKIAAASIYATAGVDKTVGIPVCVGAITRQDGFRWVDGEEKKELAEFNESFSGYFRDLLKKSLAAAFKQKEGEDAEGQ